MLRWFRRWPRAPASALCVGLICCLPWARGADEEAQATPVSSSVSFMLLTGLGFLMLMFYLVHWPNREIRRYSWQVISKAVSIFCSALLFQGVNGLVEEYAIRDHGKVWEVVVDMTQLVFWLTTFQVVFAVTSGAINQLWGGTCPSIDVVELRVKSWAVLFAHLSGFAAINAGGCLQQNIFSSTPLETVCVVPLGWMGLVVMYHGYDSIRETATRIGDGAKDEYNNLWDDEVEKAEDDVAGMSLSFLVVQSVRFSISGALPNQEGNEEWKDAISHTHHQCELLLGSGFACFVLSLWPLVVEACFQERIEKLPHTTQQRVTRLTVIWNNLFTFGSAWCMFYGTEWCLASVDFTAESSVLGVVLALVLSALAFLFIFLLDKIVDTSLLGHDSEVADAGVDKLITALGVLVGFSWEQSFGLAVGVVATSNEDLCHPSLLKMFVSVLVVAVIFPAWRLHILRKEHGLAEDGGELAEDGHGKHILKVAAQQHCDTFLSTDVDEHALDLTHLKLKHQRRMALGVASTVQRAAVAGLKHLCVTAAGIVEVGEPSVERRHMSSQAHSEITKSLLS